jgi:hypothetical protein
MTLALSASFGRSTLLRACLLSSPRYFSWSFFTLRQNTTARYAASIIRQMCTCALIGHGPQAEIVFQLVRITRPLDEPSLRNDYFLVPCSLFLRSLGTWPRLLLLF